MRLALWLALIPCVAHAHGVLIVPENDAARTVMESLVEQLGRPGLTLKTAGGRSPAIACLKDRNAHNRNQCLVAAAASANVSGLLLVSASTARRVVTAQFEVVSEETGKPVFAETLKAPEGKVGKAAGPLVKRLVAVLLELGTEKAPEPVRPRPEKPPEPVAVVKPPDAHPRPDVPPVKPVEPTPDAPRVAHLEPKPQEPVAVRVTSPEPKPHVAAWTVTGVAIAGAGVAIVAGLMGQSNKAKVETQTNGISNLNYTEAVQLQGQANQQLTVALGSAVGAAVCGGVAAFLWSRE